MRLLFSSSPSHQVKYLAANVKGTELVFRDDLLFKDDNGQMSRKGGRGTRTARRVMMERGGPLRLGNKKQHQQQQDARLQSTSTTPFN